jgi:hypothetical protein
VGRSRWLLYGGLLGVFLMLSPNVETTALPRGEQVTVRVGVFSWFRYLSREESWSEGGKDYRREETGTHMSLTNPSVLAGAVGLGLLAACWWRSRKS